MGCTQSRPEDTTGDDNINNEGGSLNKNLKEFKEFKWNSEKPMNIEDLKKEREMYWDTEPAYYGKKEVWEALRKICESSSLSEAQSIADSISLKFPTGNISDGCYDDLGVFYRLPPYCFSSPENLITSEVKKEINDKVVESKVNTVTDITIRIRLTTAEDVNLDVSSKDTINQVLERLVKVKGWGEEGNPMPKVRFIYLGKILSPSSTLQQLKVGSDAVVQAQVSF